MILLALISLIGAMVALTFGFLILSKKDPNASLNRNPPSSGIIGSTLNIPTARFNQKIQYNALIIPQNKSFGIILRGPIII